MSTDMVNNKKLTINNLNHIIRCNTGGYTILNAYDTHDTYVIEANQMGKGPYDLYITIDRVLTESGHVEITFDKFAFGKSQLRQAILVDLKSLNSRVSMLYTVNDFLIDNGWVIK